MATLSTCAQDGSGSLNPMSFTDQHGNIVLERLRYQRDTGRFCDVYIVVKDRHFCAHRNILAACSPYFDSILKNSKVVKEQVTVNCQNPAVFELLLNYMYSGSVVIDRTSVTDLLKLANNFLVTRVKNYCAEYLDRYMDSTNCLSVKELALKYNLPALLKSACDFFDVNINRCLLESTDIVEFSLAQLNALLSEPKYANSISADVHLKLIVRWIGHNPSQRDSLFKEMLAACSFASIQSATLEYLLDYSPFLINTQEARYTLMQMMCKHSMPMAKYQAQYRTLSAQFDSEKNIYYNDAHMRYGGSTQPLLQLHGISQGENSFTMNIKSENGSSQSVRNGDEAQETDTNEMQSHSNYNEETGQPPVVGASTTEEVLRSTEASDGSRPALKLKIHLNSMNILNRKNRLLAAAGRHKFYRKSVTAANQMLTKRRGRPPKNKTFLRTEALKTEDDGAMGKEFYSDCGIDVNEQVVFDHEDEVDPCSQHDESENEAQGETSSANVEKPFKCDYCPYRSTTAVRIKHHIIRAHTRDIAYVCPLCVYECRWNRDYYEHMRTHFAGPPFQCDICQCGNDCIQSLLTHRLTHSDDRPFKCTLCEYKSRSRNNLIIHIRNHTVDKPFHCPECGRAFAVKNTLDQHLAAHSESRPYQCHNCDFSTKYQSHLISHRRIHSGDVFHCHYEECTYSSPKKSQLAAHLRTHLAVRAHHCKTCNRSFIEKSHLVRHERIHLEDKPFKCDNCDYSSSRRDKLKEHIQKHHSNSSGGKQHRRRYRRAKQLAQLTAQAKTQPNMENMFRPIPPLELVGNSSISLTGPVSTTLLPQQNVTEYALSNVPRPQNEHRQPQTEGRVAATQQTHPHSLMDFSSLSTTNPLNIGRPSSATVPATTAMSVSPAMSLNFHIGAIMDSPIESLRTPVPKSPHSVSIHSDFYDGSSPATGGQDAQRPMSLPPYSGGGSSTTNNQVGSSWPW